MGDFHRHILKRRFSLSQSLLVADVAPDQETRAMLKTKGVASTPEQKALATNFAKALKESGVAPKDIAEKCGGITEQAVSNWKRSGKIAAKHLPAVSALTGWPVERLLGQVEGDGRPGATQLRPQNVHWPYKRIDYGKLIGLSGTDAINLENAILAAAGDINIDIRAGGEAKREAA